MQLFISHSSRDLEWVEPVRKRIEAAGFQAYLAEYDIAGIGHDLTAKIQREIDASAAMVVVLTENAARSSIVREEIGYALGRNKLVVPLVSPMVAQSPASLGMLNGPEYIAFDIEDPQEGLVKLTDWVNAFARQKLEDLHRALFATHQAMMQEQQQQLASQAARMEQLQAQNDLAMLLLVFVGAIAIGALIAKSG